MSVERITENLKARKENETSFIDDLKGKFIVTGTLTGITCLLPQGRYAIEVVEQLAVCTFQYTVDFVRGMDNMFNGLFMGMVPAWAVILLLFAYIYGYIIMPLKKFSK